MKRETKYALRDKNSNKWVMIWGGFSNFYVHLSHEFSSDMLYKTKELALEEIKNGLVYWLEQPENRKANIEDFVLEELTCSYQLENLETTK